MPVLSIAASGPKNPEFLVSVTSELLKRVFKIADFSNVTVLLDSRGLHEYDCFLSSNVPLFEENDIFVFIVDTDANFHDLAPQYMIVRLLFKTPMIIKFQCFFYIML